MSAPVSPAETRAAWLAARNGGNTPPAAVQIVFHLLAVLPRDVSENPTSALFRCAMRAYYDAHGLAVFAVPSRREVRGALVALDRMGALPSWVAREAVTRS